MPARTGPKYGKSYGLDERVSQADSCQANVVELLGKAGTRVGAYGSKNKDNCMPKLNCNLIGCQNLIQN